MFAGYPQRRKTVSGLPRDDVLTVERLDGENVGATLKLEDVLLLGWRQAETGAPLIAAPWINAEIVEHGPRERSVAFKKKRRKNTHRKPGIRQHNQAQDHAIDGGAEQRRLMATKRQAVPPRNGRTLRPAARGERQFRWPRRLAPATSLSVSRGQRNSSPEEEIVGTAKDHTLFGSTRTGKVTYRQGSSGRT